MKNQYFGDVNDFRKYGLLRILTGQIASQNDNNPKNKLLSLAVCWMLTPDDNNSKGNRPHGNRTNYLNIPQPNVYSNLDNKLYNYLIKLDIANGKNRNVKSACHDNCLKISSCFYSDHVPHGKHSRTEYFSKFIKEIHEVDIVFFDPDNGMNVMSQRYGTINSPKYLYWCELIASYWSGHSIVLYQHFGRPTGGRELFIKNMAIELKRSIGIDEIYSFKSSHVVFFLLPQNRHRDVLDEHIEYLREKWSRRAGFNQIKKH